MRRRHNPRIAPSPHVSGGWQAGSCVDKHICTLNSNSLLWKFGALFCLIIVAGHIIWYGCCAINIAAIHLLMDIVLLVRRWAERTVNPGAFNPIYILGVGDGIW